MKTETEDTQSILDDAIRSQATCAVRWADLDETARSIVSRVVAVDAGGVWLALPGESVADVERVVGRSSAAITLRRPDGDERLFVGFILGVRRDGAPMVRVATPATLTDPRRRSQHRLELGPEESASMKTRAWRIDERVPLRDRPAASREWRCTILDLSLGGMRVALWPRHAVTPPPATGDRSRFEIFDAASDEPMLIGGHVLHVRSDAGGLSVCNICFETHAYSVAARRDASRLQRLVATMQRSAIRRRANAA